VCIIQSDFQSFQGLKKLKLFKGHCMKYSISCLKSAFAALCESFAAIILNDFLQHWPRLLSWRILLSHCCLFFEAHKKNPFWQEKFPEE
jgi:hypothetical protein